MEGGPVVDEIAKHTDLSDEAPGSRAVVGEDFELRGELPLLKLILKATMAEGSPLHRLIATIVITLSGCFYAITLWVIGLHRWDSACGLLLPPVVYLVFPLAPAGRKSRARAEVAPAQSPGGAVGGPSSGGAAGEPTSPQ
jgi:hypothetical protein